MIIMGRTNGKLVQFLKEALQRCLYHNLTFDQGHISFTIDCLRFKESMDPKDVQIYIDWFRVNKRCYKNYSNGKAVLKAAMKKSIYLVYLGKCGTKLKYRFSTADEATEKKLQQKRKRNNFHEDPPSVSSSSGYESSPDGFYSDSEGEVFKPECQKLETEINPAENHFPALNFGDLLNIGYEELEPSMNTEDSPVDFSLIDADANLSVIYDELQRPLEPLSSCKTGEPTESFLDYILCNKDNEGQILNDNQKLEDCAGNNMAFDLEKEFLNLDKNEIAVKNEGISSEDAAVPPSIPKSEFQSPTKRTI